MDALREQLPAIEASLNRLQRRYPILDLAYEFRVWVLRMEAKKPALVDFSMDFQRHLEVQKRAAESNQGAPAWRAAFDDAPHLLDGFSRLAAYFRRWNYIRPEEAAEFARAFSRISEEEWNRIVDAAINRCDAFPYITTLKAIRAELSAPGGAGKTPDADRELQAEREEQERLDRQIEDLSPAEREQLRSDALDRIREQGVKPPFDRFLLGQTMRTLFAERLGATTEDVG